MSPSERQSQSLTRGIRNLKGRLSLVPRRMMRMLYRRLYRDQNAATSNSILVAGTGRSGTTWLAELIASQLPARILFEPFHAKLVEEFEPFHYFQYMRPGDEDDRLQDFCEQVFSGSIRHRWVDRHVAHLHPTYRVVKEIRANLFLRWIHDRFPEVPLLLLLRHPCAVVHSRMRLEWATDTDIQPFLNQPKCVEDFLADKMEVIRGCTTPEEKHAVVWCVSNLVPLRQFEDAALPVFYYEHLLTHPEKEIPRLFQTIGKPYEASVFDRIKKPSQTTFQSSAIAQGKDLITGWQQSLTNTQIKNILSVVAAFGLDDRYGEDPLPRI